ncbi:MAG: hypothetical protein PHE15_01320 [Dehalococcoidales bacterium]|nr:hypothetical protein [Dehalococcoidales bacterium]
MNNKLIIKTLRQIGIVGVVLPDPVTTAIGVGFLAYAQYLSNADKKNRIKINHNKKSNRFPCDFAHPNVIDDNDVYTSYRINYYSYDRSRRDINNIPVQYKYNHIAGSNPKPAPELINKSVTLPENCRVLNVNRQWLFQLKAEGMLRKRIIPTDHAFPDFRMMPRRVNIDTLAKRYKQLENKTTNYNDSRVTGKDSDVIQCAVNTRLLACYKEMEKLENAKSVKTATPKIRSRIIDKRDAAETL